MLNVGTVRKDFDPITKTQTDPIAYKKKMEEIKDGVKAAPKPSFKFYNKSDFLTLPPMEKRQQKSFQTWEQDRIPSWGEPIPEDLGGEDSSGDDSWWADTWDDGKTSSNGSLEEGNMKQSVPDSESSGWDAEW